MNKIITVFAALLVSTAVVAAPAGRGGNRGGHRSAPARTVQRAPAARPAARTAARPASTPAVKASRNVVSRPYVSKPAPVGPKRPAGTKVERIHHPKGPRHGFGHHPRPIHRHWVRPPMPPIRPLALYAWTWIATPWTILVDGVYYSGDGYWFDGYNYYYNDCYYTSAPVSVSVSFGF